MAKNYSWATLTEAGWAALSEIDWSLLDAEQVASLGPAKCITPEKYLGVARAYAGAMAAMASTTAQLREVVQGIANTTDKKPIVDLIHPFHSVYVKMNTDLSATTTFEGAVRAIQVHVTKHSTQKDVVAFVQEEIIYPGLADGIPAEWAAVSKIVEFDIDAVIEPS